MIGLSVLRSHPTSRSVWLHDPASAAIALTIAFTLLRLLACSFVGLGTNEAYAIASGRFLSLSYFDHPPLHFWLAFASERVFGDTRFARLPFIMLGAGSSWLMFDLARQLYGERAGLWTAFLFNTSVFFSIVAGSWILPDGPLNFFLLAAVRLLVPLAKSQRISVARWLFAGLAIGLAALSKYHAIVVALGLFGFLVTSRRTRSILLSLGPWLAALLALAVFSPVIFWNAEYGWISLYFQGGRAVRNHFGPGIFLSLLVAQIALISPWIVMPLVQGILKARERWNEADRLLFWIGLPCASFFSLVPLWSDAGMVQWAMPGWLLLLPLAGKGLADKKDLEHWAVTSTLIFLLFVGLACIEFQTTALNDAFPHLFRRGDPTTENSEWGALATVLTDRNPLDRDRTVVVTSDWRDAAKIDQGLRGAFELAVASRDPRNFAIGIAPNSLKGRDGWIVLSARTSAGTVASVTHCFTTAAPFAIVPIYRGRQPDAVLNVWRGEGYMPERCGVLDLQELIRASR